MVGAQRRSGRRNINDDIGLTGSGCAFGGAQAFHDAVKLNAVAAGEELLRQTPVFGGNGQTATMAGAKFRRHIAEVGHGFHIEPDIRHGDDDIGMAKAQTGAEFDAGIGIGQPLAHQILTRDAEIDAARAQFA